MIQTKLNNIIQKKWFYTVLFYATILAVIFAVGYLSVTREPIMGLAIPIVLLLAVIAFTSYDKLIWIVVALAPLSIPLHEIMPGLPFDMHLPTEPMLLLVLVLFMLSIFAGKRLPKSLLRHPVSIVIYGYLGWMTISAAVSELPVVSFKMLLTRIWFIIAFYFLLGTLFENKKKIHQFLWVFIIALMPVIAYTILRHLSYGLYNKQAAHWVMTPFFNDHTSYGAIIAFFIPIAVAYTLSELTNTKQKIWSFVTLGILIIAQVLSYTRASWLSLFFGIGIWVLIKLKIKFRTILITIVAFTAFVFAFHKQILMAMEQNSTESSENLTTHFSSMTNISSDASNLERINRWSCAIRMFKEKPVFGWGPGTYAMEYAPYQLTKDRTIISTNSGNGGNAHSEYLGSLAESGLLGMINYFILLIAIMYTGITAYVRLDDKKLKTVVLATIVGFSTYIFHGILNNFLDTDKISIPFWGFTAIMVALDIYSKKQKNTPKDIQSEL